MNTLNVLVMAPNMGRDLSYIPADPRIRVLDGNEAYWAEMRDEGRVPARPQDAGRRFPSREERDALLAQADVLLVGFPVPRGLASRAPRLKWAHHTQAGVSNLLGTDLWTSSAVLTSSRGAVAATAIAEFAIAAAFHFARGLHEATRQKAAGQFSAREYRSMVTLQSATMGIIGLGGIGREVARLANAVGMRVIGTRRSITTPQENADGADLLLPADRLLDVAAESDFLAICSQLTPETRGMVNARVFAAMKPSAVLINIARGEEVDEDALIAAVRQGRLRGAVLDVYDGELDGKPPRRELLDLTQIILTPHISPQGDTRLTEPAKQIFAENLRRFLDGRPLLNVVDRQRGY
jgi:phosphoglycerate dehydrogenase-like enzyme